MQTRNVAHERREFCFSNLDTLVRVEELDDTVIVRATRNTFSDQRKILFIHELAADGFITETYQWFSGFDTLSAPPVRWMVDASWPELDAGFRKQTNRLMISLLVVAILLWLSMMSTLLLLST